MTEHQPLRAVVDTNLFVSGLILKRGIPFALLEAWRAGDFVLISSDALRRELAQVLERPRLRERYRLSDQDVSDTVFALETMAERAPHGGKVPIPVRDPKDQMVLEAAFAGHARYLVTGDDDLLTLHGDRRLGRLQIVTARAFLEVLATGTDETQRP